MPLYPLPVILAVIFWILLFSCTGLKSIISFLIVFGCGLIVYFIHAKLQHKWPYATGSAIQEKDGSSLNSVN